MFLIDNRGRHLMVRDSFQHIAVEVDKAHRGERIDEVEQLLEKAGMDIITRFKRTGILVGLVSKNRLDEIRKTVGVANIETGR